VIENHDDPCETTHPATHVRRHRGSRSPKRGNLHMSIGKKITYKPKLQQAPAWS
jgi:hypothetical protein